MQCFFTAEHKNPEICRKSSSGGAFTAITDTWFHLYKEQAVVYGCVFDDGLRVRHIRGTSVQDRDRMRGSKYIGSDMSGIMRQVAEDLKCGKYVAFSGTPCQIAGLKAFLHLKEVDIKDQLLTIEVICHGVGSIRFFEDYIHHLEKVFRAKTEWITFRAKRRPGKKQDVGIRFSNGKNYFSSTTRYDWFYSAYLNNYILRPGCYTCQFAKPERYADITIGDHSEKNIGLNRCLSLVITNSDKGLHIFNLSMENMQCEFIPHKWTNQINFNAPSAKPINYEQFWKQYRNEGYLGAQRYLGNHTLKGYLRAALLEIAYNFRLIEIAKYGKIIYRRLEHNVFRCK